MPSRSGITLSHDQLILVTMLIRIALMAFLAAFLSRFETFKTRFFSEREDLRGRLYFTALMGGMFSFGVIARILLGYTGTDLSLEGTVLAGLIAGPVVGMAVGALVGLPPLAIGEYAALPMGILYGLAGGILHIACFKRRPRISFSPITLIFGRWFRREWFSKPHLKEDLFLLLSILCLSLLNLGVARWLGDGLLFTQQPENWLTLAALLIGKAVAVAVPLMIWDHTYIEIALRNRDRGLMQARLDALKSKIQPHFLFNTLNTIAATIRVNPEQARNVVLKLAQILRTILDTREDFRSLESEIQTIEDFLDIERARYGEDRIKVEKWVDPDLLQIQIPSLLIQPIVENSVIHGLRRKVGANMISIAARKEDGHIQITVEDDGIGIPPERLKSVKDVGIGLSNVEERLRVLYGSDYRFDIVSEPEKGTRTMISFPIENQISASARVA